MFLIHANDKRAPLAHQQLLQHVMTREALRRCGQKENDKQANATIQQSTEAWDTTLKTRGQPEKTPLNNPLVPLATALYKWGTLLSAWETQATYLAMQVQWRQWGLRKRR